MGNNFEMVAKNLFGFEPLLAKELKDHVWLKKHNRVCCFSKGPASRVHDPDKTS